MATVFVRQERVLIVVPTGELKRSLFRRLSSFPGEKGMVTGHDDYHAVELTDFPRKPAELERVLAEVRAWLAEVGLLEITVESRWRVRSPRAGASTRARRPVLSWKWEDGPPDATEPSPDDVGPAWVDIDGEDGPETEWIADGEWVTRAEAERLAEARGYDFAADD